MTQSQLPTTPNLGTRIRQQVEGTLARLGKRLHQWGVHPDLLTWLGLLFVIVAAVFAARGDFALAAVILVVGMPLDALDGAVARAMKRTNLFGGVLDSVIDRYADLFILLGLAYYLAVDNAFNDLLLAFAAVVGSTLVSYIRARAGVAGLQTAGGLFSRLERSAVLILTLFLAGFFGRAWLTVGLAILAAGSNLTALQRLWSVRCFANEQQTRLHQMTTEEVEVEKEET